MKGSLRAIGQLLAGVAVVVLLAGCPVPAPVDDVVTVTPDTADLEVGQTAGLQAESTNAGDTTFTWASSNAAIVEVLQTAGTAITVRGVAPGTATVTATGSASGVAGEAVITVPEEEEPETPVDIQPALLAPGLKVTVQSVSIPADRRPEILFKATNDKNQNIAKSEFASLRFILARLQAGGLGETPKFASYTTTPANGQATYDSAQLNGLTQFADGSFKYKFATALPADYDASAVHQVGGQMARLYAIDGQQYPANPVFTFRPDNELPVTGRDVVATVTCNKCHTRLEFHGGQRREMQLCILCHTPQSVDPESGNTVDMTQMIHKIHMGSQLPSVQDGGSYEIVGHQGHVYDYSEIVFPQRIANCTACHNQANEAQGNRFLTSPTIEACGSCHDRTWFGNPTQTPAGYTNHPMDFEQSDSRSCAVCHDPALSTIAPIDKAHAAITEPGLLMDILDVTPNPETGELKVQFSLTYGDGSPITNVKAPQRVGAIVAWPASDYQNHFTETLGGTRAITGAIDTYTSETGVYNYTFATKLPVPSTDTFAVALTGRLAVEDEDGEEVEIGTSSNGLTFFTVDGTDPEPRREVVLNQKCNACHNEVRGHGEQRFGVEVCVMCHRPNASAEGETINFKEMLHYAHTGADLDNGYEVGDWNVEDIHFPGKREACTMCHAAGTFNVPLPADAQPTVVTDGDATHMIPATRAACTSCHDSAAADTHAYLASNSQGVESCAVCHGSAADASVASVHAVAP